MYFPEALESASGEEQPVNCHTYDITEPIKGLSVQKVFAFARCFDLLGSSSKLYGNCSEADSEHSKLYLIEGKLGGITTQFYSDPERYDRVRPSWFAIIEVAPTDEL